MTFPSFVLAAPQMQGKPAGIALLLPAGANDEERNITMKTTLTALAVAFALTAGFGAANAMPTSGDSFDYETIFAPKD